jgi:hypothetical protein
MGSPFRCSRSPVRGLDLNGCCRGEGRGLGLGGVVRGQPSPSARPGCASGERAFAGKSPNVRIPGRLQQDHKQDHRRSRARCAALVGRSCRRQDHPPAPSQWLPYKRINVAMLRSGVVQHDEDTVLRVSSSFWAGSARPSVNSSEIETCIPQLPRAAQARVAAVPQPMALLHDSPPGR